MGETLASWIVMAGIGQLGVLAASALAPSMLGWKAALQQLPRLHRQMFWAYAGYVALAIVTFALISLYSADELARGSGLARGVCGYIAVFWGARLVLQWVFDVKPYLTTRWHRLGYHLLTVLFAGFTLLYGVAALWSAD